jgi:phage recombination protein Bet
MAKEGEKKEEGMSEDQVVTPESPKAKDQQLATMDFSPESIDLIKRTIAVGATDDELKLFLYTAKKSGLDPLVRQIYFVKRKSKTKEGQWEERMTMQTSIDGLRVIAERSGKYNGQTKVEYGPVGDDGRPEWAEVGVYKKGFEHPTYGRAYWDEYVATRYDQYSKKNVPSGMWGKMPKLMLAKCAEALALRKAFPQDLSGIYTSEEMAQADVEPKSVQAAFKATQTLATKEQKDKLIEILEFMGRSKEWFETQTGRPLDEMSQKKVQEAITAATAAFEKQKAADENENPDDIAEIDIEKL